MNKTELIARIVIILEESRKKEAKEIIKEVNENQVIYTKSLSDYDIVFNNNKKKNKKGKYKKKLGIE